MHDPWGGWQGRGNGGYYTHHACFVLKRTWGTGSTSSCKTKYLPGFIKFTADQKPILYFAVTFSFAVEIILFCREFLFSCHQTNCFGVHLFSWSCFLFILPAVYYFAVTVVGHRNMEILQLKKNNLIEKHQQRVEVLEAELEYWAPKNVRLMVKKSPRSELDAVRMSRASPANRADLSHENLYFSTT